MRMPYFIWRGQDSRDMGLVVNVYPPLARAKERVSEVVVPGRSGTLTMREALDVFDPVVRTVQATALPGCDFVRLYGWLRGEGALVLGNEPQYVHRARLDGQIDFDKVLRGHEHRSAALPFVCQPWKELAEPGADIVVTTSGTAVTNPGTLYARPLLRVEGSGDGSVAIAGYLMQLRGMSGGMLLDSDMQDAFDLGGNTMLNDKVSGFFPLMQPGVNLVNFTGGVTKVTITPRWRYL